MALENFDVQMVENFLPSEKAKVAFDELMNAPFVTPTFLIRGRPCTPNRKMIAFGDSGVCYSFSGATFEAHPWTPLIRELKESVENASGTTYNYVLVNFYPDGHSRIAAHKDDENSLDPETPIPCISLGATRKVIFRRRGYSKKTFILTSGSLYVMNPPTNSYWTHEIPAEVTVKSPRISLTFRHIYFHPSNKSGVNNISPPPSKRRCIEKEFEESTLDTFFKTLSPDLLIDSAASNDSPMQKI